MLIVFVTGVDKIAVVGGCVIVSVLIHYFSLASVLWMLAVSLLMFQKMVFVFKTVTKKGIIITSTSCWCKLIRIKNQHYSTYFPQYYSDVHDTLNA